MIEMKLRNRIIHESLKLFSYKGFLNTSIDDILSKVNASKGGLYNHFKSKDELFLVVMEEARRIWRQKVLHGVSDIDDPLEKIRLIIINYRDRYLKDTENIPGGCVFVTLSVELDDQRPEFAKEIQKGFDGVKGMIKRFLDQAQALGRLPENVHTADISELLFSGMLGASVQYGMSKSSKDLHRAINPLIGYIDSLPAKNTAAIDRNPAGF